MSDGTTPPNDPMHLMRDAYAQGIERWSKAMEEIVGSEDFAAASGQLLALYAQQQQSIRAASRVAAESIQMPTTDDLAEVARLVINVERKVDEVTDQAADVATRLTAIETRLADTTAAAHAIPTRLTAIEERLAEVASASQALSERLTPIDEAIRELASAAAKETAETTAPATAKAPSAKAPAAKAPSAKARATKKSAPATSAPARRTRPADG
jgi:chromosome segregation ATPase